MNRSSVSLIDRDLQCSIFLLFLPQFFLHDIKVSELLIYFCTSSSSPYANLLKIRISIVTYSISINCDAKLNSFLSFFFLEKKPSEKFIRKLLARELKRKREETRSSPKISNSNEYFSLHLFFS